MNIDNQKDLFGAWWHDKESIGCNLWRPHAAQILVRLDNNTSTVLSTDLHHRQTITGSKSIRPTDNKIMAIQQRLYSIKTVFNQQTRRHTHNPISKSHTVVDCVWNVMAHAQKPDFVFRRNGRIHLNRRGRQFGQLLAAEVWASAVVMLDTPCSEVVWRVLATHSIHQFPLHFPSRASPCAIRFQLDSNYTDYVVPPPRHCIAVKSVGLKILSGLEMSSAFPATLGLNGNVPSFPSHLLNASHCHNARK